MIVAVWGNSGSGKSTLAIKLANSFSRMSKNVVLVDTNFIAPQANIWYPRLEIKPEDSLAVLLDNNITSDEIVVSKVNVVSQNVGVIGYAKDSSVNMAASRADTADELLRRLDKIFDVAIIDCQSGAINDPLSFSALDGGAAAVVIAPTPDIRGLSWYDANVKMFEERWANDGKLIFKAFNQSEIAAPVVDMENAIGTVQYYLPFDVPLKKELYIGTLGGTNHRKTSRAYTRIVDSLAADILEPKKPEER